MRTLNQQEMTAVAGGTLCLIKPLLNCLPKIKITLPKCQPKPPVCAPKPPVCKPKPPACKPKPPTCNPEPTPEPEPM